MYTAFDVTKNEQEEDFRIMQHFVIDFIEQSAKTDASQEFKDEARYG